MIIKWKKNKFIDLSLWLSASHNHRRINILILHECCPIPLPIQYWSAASLNGINIMPWQIATVALTLARNGRQTQHFWISKLWRASLYTGPPLKFELTDFLYQTTTLLILVWHIICYHDMIGFQFAFFFGVLRNLVGLNSLFVSRMVSVICEVAMPPDWDRLL